MAVPLIVANVAFLAIDVGEARNAASAEANRLAEAVSSALDEALAGTRAALVTIAAGDELQTLDATRCTDELEVLLPQFPEYSNVWAADREGRVLCTAEPTSGTVTVADRDWFQLAIGGQPFAVGGYQIGAIVNRPLIIGVVPIRTSSGSILGTVQAAIELDSLATITAGVELPDGATVTILDRSGTVLVRTPDPDGFVGLLTPESDLVAAVLAGHPGTDGDGDRDHAATPLTGLDGVERLYAIHGVATGDDALHVAVGFSVDRAFAGAARRFATGMALLGAALLVALVLMVSVARRLIVGPVETLVVAANQIARGDLGARTGLGGSDELGRLADAFDRMAESVQERVEARTAELSAAVAELEDADRRVHEYLDTAVDPLVVLEAVRGPDGTISDFRRTFANEPALELLGPDLSRPGGSLRDLAPELAEARIQTYAGVLESGQPLEYEATLPHARTAEIVDLHARATKVGDGVAVAFRDVSSAKRLQRALESAKAEAERAREAAESARAEAERANHSKTEFLSRVSHELRTPLNSVIGFAQILEMDGLPADQAESVDHILRSGRHLLDLINEVLDISRIEAGTLTTSPEAVHVGEAIAEAVDVIAPIARERGVAVRVRALDDEPGHVLADRQRLKQILLNLLSNAVKFNRPAGTIEVGASVTPAGRCRISVTDEGPGIAEAMRDRVFAPFDRLGAEGGRIEGTGLGLSLSRALAERMDGSLDFESVVGSGSTFWVELPIAEDGPATAAGSTPRAAPTGTHGTVLYIEDNLSNLQLVTRIFERHGDVQVVPAMLGGLGLELARDRPDLILLDLHLPDMGGDEVLARLMADPETRAVPVVVMSADASSGLLERLMAMGASAFVTKPIAIGEFLAAVERLLPRRPPPQADA
ncbi:MAG: ATP-binding protein [Chloroflexota bacterium]